MAASLFGGRREPTKRLERFSSPDGNPVPFPLQPEKKEDGHFDTEVQGLMLYKNLFLNLHRIHFDWWIFS